MPPYLAANWVMKEENYEEYHKALKNLPTMRDSILQLALNLSWAVRALEQMDTEYFSLSFHFSFFFKNIFGFLGF
jgi:hypothetical protein